MGFLEGHSYWLRKARVRVQNHLVEFEVCDKAKVSSSIKVAHLMCASSNQSTSDLKVFKRLRCLLSSLNEGTKSKVKMQVLVNRSSSN